MTGRTETYRAAWGINARLSRASAPAKAFGYVAPMGKRGKKGKAARERKVPVHTKMRQLVGLNVAHLMTVCSVSAQDIATATKMDRRTVNRLVNGEVASNLDTLGAIMDLMKSKNAAVEYGQLLSPRSKLMEGDSGGTAEPEANSAERNKGRMSGKS